MFAVHICEVSRSSKSTVAKSVQRGTLALGLIFMLIATVGQSLSYADEPSRAQTMMAGGSQKIVGGSQAKVQDAPWQVAIAKSRIASPGKTPFARQICGGALIAPTMVVTAAHCVMNRRSRFKASDLSVISGRANLNNVQSGTETDVRAIYMPRDSENRLRYVWTAGWDVAILELNSPSGSDTISIVGDGENDLLRPGTRVDVYGWGSTDSLGDRYPMTLRTARTNIQRPYICRRERTGSYNSRTDLCFGDAWGRSISCYADSGGPFTVSSNGETRLVGIVSRGTYEPCFGILADIATSVGSAPVRNWISGIVTTRTGVNPVGSGASAGPPAALGAAPRVVGRSVRGARKTLRAAGISRVRIYRLITRIPRRSKPKRPRVMFNTVPKGWLWSPKATYALYVDQQKRHREVRR